MPCSSWCCHVQVFTALVQHDSADDASRWKVFPNAVAHVKAGQEALLLSWAAHNMYVGTTTIRCDAGCPHCRVASSCCYAACLLSSEATCPCISRSDAHDAYLLLASYTCTQQAWLAPAQACTEWNGQHVLRLRGQVCKGLQHKHLVATRERLGKQQSLSHATSAFLCSTHERTTTVW